MERDTREMENRIGILPDGVANQIAAGEVVSRPASVVKELLENAVDAGSTAVTLHFKDGGRELIQVVDNGCGMSEPDARLAFERHATSKIRKAEDLYRLSSFGFRARRSLRSLRWPKSSCGPGRPEAKWEPRCVSRGEFRRTEPRADSSGNAVSGTQAVLQYSGAPALS